MRIYLLLPRLLVLMAIEITFAIMILGIFRHNCSKEADVSADAVTWYVNSDMPVLFAGNGISEVLVSLRENNIGVLFTQFALADA